LSTIHLKRKRSDFSQSEKLSEIKPPLKGSSMVVNLTKSNLGISSNLDYSQGPIDGPPANWRFSRYFSRVCQYLVRKTNVELQMRHARQR
jgi:hypothetical protein